MALQVWLPLNGNLNNNGCSKLTFSATTPTAVNASGKFGKCYTNTSNSTGGIVSNTTINLGQNQSMFCWFKFTSLESSASLGGGLVGQHRYSTFTGMGITIKYVSSTTGYLSVNTGNGSGRTYNTYCGTTLLQANTWYHGGYTYDGSTLKIYVNSNCENTTSITGMSVPADYVTAFCWSLNGNSGSGLHGDYKFNGSLNDIRIYDHCLSQREIIELVKGLVVHYPLNNNGNNISNLVDNSATFSGWSAGSGWTLGTSDDGTKMYSFSRTGATSNNWVRLIPTLRVNGNDYPNGITVSMELLTPDKSAINNKCVGSLQQYDASGARTGWCEPGWDFTNVVNGKWSKISYSFTKAQLLTNSQGLVYSYTMFSFQLVQNGNISIRKIKIEPGTTATRYSVSDNDRNNPTIVYDTSGFKYNATRVGSATIVASSPKYESSMNFSNAGYLITSDFNVTTNAFTMNFWVNPRSISAQHFLLGTFSSWTGNGFGIYRDPGSNTIYRCILKSDSASSYAGNTITVTLNTWNMITIVYTGTVYKGYLNGTKVFEMSYGSSGTITNPNLMLANSKYNSTPTSENEEAYISDFRLYTTVLSDAAIKELYQTSTSITNNGTLMAYEFIEE